MNINNNKCNNKYNNKKGRWLKYGDDITSNNFSNNKNEIQSINNNINIGYSNVPHNRNTNAKGQRC